MNDTLPPRKTVMALATLGMLVTLPQAFPQLANYRVFDWSSVPEVLDFVPRRISSEPLAEENARLRPDLQPDKLSEAKLQDPFGNMDLFYAALLHTERKDPDAVTRILHFGDSPTTADLITSDARALLQMRFGDAGHGSYLIAKPWAWYDHRGIGNSAGGWSILPATQRGEKDGIYGLAGVSFRGSEGAWARFTLRDAGSSHVSVSYLASPGAGRVELVADEETIDTIDTDLPAPLVTEQRFRIPAGTRTLQLKVVRGSVRLFRVSLEKDGPGVVYHSLGLNGAHTAMLAWHFDAGHFSEQLRQTKPNLVIINYGTNESVYPSYVETSFTKDLTTALRRIRSAVPEASILVMSPMDRGIRQPGGAIGTVPVLPQLVALQSRVAAEEKVAFYNTFQAMGGPGTMARWYQAEPRLVSADFIHPLPNGAKIVGNLLYQALMEGYNRYKLKQLRRIAASTAMETAR